MKLLVGTLVATVLAAAAHGETVLRYGQIPSSIRSMSSLPFQIAERQGYFARQGLKIEPVPVEGGTDFMIQALDKGTVDITRTATPYLITAVMAGSDAVAIAEEVGNSIYSLIAKPDIKSFADLKGKTVGLSLAVDTISISSRLLIAKNGLTDGDYTVKELVGTPQRGACLKSGECDAVPLGQPEDFQAIAQSYNRLGLSTEAVPDSVMTVSAARRAWAAENKPSVTGFVRALADAFRFVRDPANRETVIKFIVEGTGSSEAIARQTMVLYYGPATLPLVGLDPSSKPATTDAQFKAALDNSGTDRGVFPKQGEINLKGLATVIGFMGEAGQIKGDLPPPERFVDLTYLHEAGLQ